MNNQSAVEFDSGFKDEVAARPGGENVKLCYACGTCTAACPVAALDEAFNPRRMIRMILLGMKRELLSSPEIWQCIQCYACYAKCPQNVKFRDIIKALRAMAVEQGFAPARIAEEMTRINEAARLEQIKLVNLLIADPSAYKQAMAALLESSRELQK